MEHGTRNNFFLPSAATDVVVVAPMRYFRYSRDIPRQPDYRHHSGSLHGVRGYFLGRYHHVARMRQYCIGQRAGSLYEIFEATKSRSFNRRNEAEYLHVAANKRLKVKQVTASRIW
jgi:hypothetical protein